ILRLGDGSGRIAYAAREVLDIATLSGALERVGGQASVVGVTLVDGETAELVDCHALFAQIAPRRAGARPLTCRLEGDDGWMRSFLGPIIEAAGYRLAADGEAADIAFVDSTADAQSEADVRKAIRLHDAPGAPGSVDAIYRYDRAALMAAL